ncbi:F-box protein At1g80960-like [Abrus precatorius]|uniref:F-box protein At1g80960-like n=1 Tax=Abrus precatorius TaxID=3816 RepID=A0A8B8KGT5_ABRPR|nr:F-box protein At1g80960-like [Abrus precatorius]
MSSPLCFVLILVFTMELLFNFIWKKWRRVHQKEDRISKLPNHVISSIVSLLPTEEAIRTSVLSKSWKTFWSNVPHLDFNQNRMLEHAFKRWFEISRDPKTSQEKLYAAYDLLMFQFDDAIKSIEKVLINHRGVLERCRIVHITDSCRNGDVVQLIRYLVTVKRVHELDMECKYVEPWDQIEFYKNLKIDDVPIQVAAPPTLNICFHILAACCVVLKLTNYVLKSAPPLRVCENLKILKLKKVWLCDRLFEGILLKCVSLEYLSLIGCKHLKKLRIHSASIKFLKLRKMTLHKMQVVAVNLEVIVLDTLVICQWKEWSVNAPNLELLHVYYGDPAARGMTKLRVRRVLLTTRVVLQRITNIGGFVRANPLQNLVSLSIDLDLNGEKDNTALYLALKLCNSLERLEINNKDYYSSQIFSVTDSIFWEIGEPCICICQTLNTVRIRGFKGKVLELEFAKHLIKKATRLTRMTIFFVDNCAQNLFSAATISLVRASKDLGITLVTAGGEEE